MSRWKLILLIVFAVFATSAVAVASASALEFYNSKGELITGTLKIVSTGGLQRLEIEVAGVKVEIHCLATDAAGTIENVGTMGLGLALILYTTCSVHAPKPKNVEGCEVPGGDIHVHAHMLAVTLNSEPYIEFTPEEGNKFVGITFASCKNTGLNGEHEVAGTAMAKVNNATSELEAKTGAGELSFAGNDARYTGTDKQEMEGGGNIKVE
jgi:hypothetical protein